ncbi:DUF305 domain-containing protein [Myceligenerans crystallogenes]|uniref:DUF305 domain-containing protein n=1 Tax=Myceligenerans crystallogenes TaxID=316335 RepID=A0ABP4ZN35_9MICO
MQPTRRPANAVARRRRPGRGRAVACGVLVAALGAAGCTGGAEPTAVSTPSSVVLQPGKPGEPARTVAPEDFTGAPAEDDWNEADAEFAAGMIRHHDQAVVMTAWVPERSASEQVKALADRMNNMQEAEIGLMSDWLTERDQPVPVLHDGGGDGTGPRVPDDPHGHDLMPGMLTAAEMAELEAASGTEFDRLFLEGMIEHHRGAIAMCSDITTTGVDQKIQELAANIGVDQQAETARMRELLDGL